MAKATDFTLLRHWWFERGEEPTIEDLKENLEDVIEAAGLTLTVQASGKGLFIISSNREYMPVSLFAASEKGICKGLFAREYRCSLEVGFHHIDDGFIPVHVPYFGTQCFKTGKFTGSLSSMPCHQFIRLL